MTPRMQVIRGLPGSGKTTLALKEFPDLLRLEADMFFTRGGEYRFTMAANVDAVEWLYREVTAAADAGMDFVVTGVFSAHTERLSRVVQIASERGYEIYIKTLDTQYGNTHGVPQDHLDVMKRTFMSDEDIKWLMPHDSRYSFGLMSRTKKGETKNEEKVDEKGVSCTS